MGARNTNTQRSRWDVIIVGGGPAGTATAITLAKQGWHTLLIEKKSSVNFKLGESIPPAAVSMVKSLLQPLGQVDALHKLMYKSRGNISCWDSAEPVTSDFFFTPAGFGLCVDRANFDQALRDSAKELGVAVQSKTQFKNCRRIHQGQRGSWQVALESSAGNLLHRANHLVDCSGRNSVVAKSLGMSRCRHDRLFAFAQRFVSTSASDTDRFTRLEAGPQGWWYSNRLPHSGRGSSERMVVFHTDKDTASAKLAANITGFSQLLKDSLHIANWLTEYDYQPVGNLRGAAAGSERLDQFCGSGWLAVGDAAQAYDPLSSQGIMKAIRSGCSAGQMLHHALSEESNTTTTSAADTFLQRYAREQEQLWLSYIKQLEFYYTSQPRWPDQPFWKRRRHSAVAESEPKQVRETS